jgi:paraquat-inducible protein B
MLVALLVVINLVASISVVRRGDLETIHKVLQILIIWLVPLIAAIGFWLYNNKNDEPLPPKDQ